MVVTLWAQGTSNGSYSESTTYFDWWFPRNYKLPRGATTPWECSSTGEQNGGVRKVKKICRNVVSAMNNHIALVITLTTSVIILIT